MAGYGRLAGAATAADLVRAGQASEPRLEVVHCGPERARHAEHSRPGLASPDAVQLDPVHPDRRRVQRLPAGGRRARSGPAGAARALGAVAPSAQKPIASGGINAPALAPTAKNGSKARPSQSQSHANCTVMAIAASGGRLTR